MSLLASPAVKTGADWRKEDFVFRLFASRPGFGLSVFDETSRVVSWLAAPAGDSSMPNMLDDVNVARTYLIP